MAYRQTEHVEARLSDNRQRILASARTLVSEGGWGEAQVANVAAAAGLATGSVYRYFASKAELFAEVLSAVSQREVDVLAAVAGTDGGPAERLRTAVVTFVRRAMRNPRLAYALIAEPCDKAIDEQRLNYRSALSQVFVGLIAEGQAQRVFRTDVSPEIAATVVVGGFMEALIGPLSPLSTQALQQPAIDALAAQISNLCCASVARPFNPEPNP